METAALLDELPNPTPCYKRGYCRASADYGSPPTPRGCEEFALHKAAPPPIPQP